LTEHVLLPLIWHVIHRKKKPVFGVESMIGEDVEVRTWENLEGQVSFRGVLWTASSDDCLTPGDTAVIEEANGLMLRIKRTRPTKATRPE
jgi:membrane-bound ClpP family serine protease